MEFNNVQNLQGLQGQWKAGWALDLHTVSSDPPHSPHNHDNCRKIISDKMICCCSKDKFVNHYNLIGALMHLFKYHKDSKVSERLAEICIEFLRTKIKNQNTPNLAAIIPIPPSDTARAFQPVYELAKIIGEKVNIKVDYDFLLKTKATTQLKSIEEPEERKKILAGAFQIKDQRYAGKKVLLFDDLYRSGETMNAATEMLISAGHVSNVYVLTITKTRSKK